MRLTKLTAAQVAYLKAQPLAGQKNRVALALGLVLGTQSALAKAAKVAESDLSLIRNGKYSQLSLDVAQRVSGALGACTDDIFPRETHTFTKPAPKRDAKAAAGKRIRSKAQAEGAAA
jgi:DNA-binding XRE family transcriptional regulator